MNNTTATMKACLWGFTFYSMFNSVLLYFVKHEGETGFEKQNDVKQKDMHVKRHMTTQIKKKTHTKK